MNSYMYTYVPSLLGLSPTPSDPSRLSRAQDLSSLHYTVNFYWLSNFIYGNVYISMLVSIHPTLSFPTCVHKSVVYVCISIADL